MTVSRLTQGYPPSFFGCGPDMRRRPTTWAEIEIRMAEYHKKVCACPTEREARPIIEQMSWTFQNMLERLPFDERYGTKEPKP